MRVAHLTLSDFRNYRTVDLSLGPGPNLIHGRNGQGKTNLVEAISYLSALRSHRVTGDSAMIRAGADAAIIRMRVRSDDRDVLLDLQLNRHGGNRAQVNRNRSKPRDLTRWFSAIMFAPEDLMIIRGEPTTRRRFLDDSVVLRSPSMAGTLADYDRVVRQRTSLLKTARVSSHRESLEAQLTIWDDQLVELGTQIMMARRELVARLEAPMASSYGSLVDGDHGPTITLRESVSQASARQIVSRETSHTLEGTNFTVSRETLAREFRNALQEVRGQEMERGVTLVGPHRDDLELRLNGLPVKGYASHGESWSFALAVKLGLAQVIREESLAGDPVIILDDVFAELDAVRRERLMRAVSTFEQVIVTAAVVEDVPASLAWRRIEVHDGQIVEDPTALPRGGGAARGADDVRE